MYTVKVVFNGHHWDKG